MHWLLLCLLVIVAWLTADVLVACGARLLSLILYAPVRRWTAIFGLFAVFVGIFFFVLVLVYSEHDRQKFSRSIVTFYESLPTIAMMAFGCASTFAIVLTILCVIGFWPRRGVPYQPQASAWNLTVRCKRIGVVIVAILATLLMQDVELRWRLARMENRADAVAQSMKPALDAGVPNAAIYYQQLVDINEGLNAWEEEHFGKRFRFGQMDPADKVIRSYMEELQPLVACFRKASRCPDCCFDDSFQPLDALDGLNTNYAIVSAVSKLTNYAHQSIQLGRPEEAIECITWIRQLETHLQQDLRNTETVFFYWYESWTQQIVEHLSTYDTELSEDLLRQVIAPPLNVNGISVNAWKWYGALLQKHLANGYSGRAYSRPEFQDDEVWADPSWRGKTVRFLTFFTMRATFARDDMTAANHVYNLLDYSFDEKPWEQYFAVEEIPQGKLVSTVSDLSYTHGYVTQSDRCRALSNIGIAVCLFHQEYDQWPESLSLLSPKYLPGVPDDPREEQPFLVKLIDDGMMVYPAWLEERFEEYEDTETWWLDIADGRFGGALFLGEAATRRKEAEAANRATENSWKESQAYGGYE